MTKRTQRLIELRDQYRDEHPGCSMSDAILWARKQLAPAPRVDLERAMLDDACAGFPALRRLVD